MSVNTDENLKKIVVRFKQGLITSDPRVANQSAAQIYDIGEIAIPTILSELQQIDLESDFSKEKNSLVSGLSIVLRDLDERAAGNFINAALKQKIHPILRSELQQTLRFSIDNYRQTYFGEILILEEKTVDERYSASSHVRSWLSTVPSKDLVSISRIYIISSHVDFDFLSSYTPHIAKIALVWDDSLSPANPLVGLLRLTNRQTLYHEVGHHRFKHNYGYGQDPIQERVADEYAAKQMRVAHPGLRRLVKFANRILQRKSPLKIFWLELKGLQNESEIHITAEVAEYSLVNALISLTEHQELLGVDFSQVDLVTEQHAESKSNYAAGDIVISEKR